MKQFDLSNATIFSSSQSKSSYSDVSMDPTKIQGQVMFLMGAYEKLCTDAKVKDDRFDSLEARVDSVDTKLSSMDSKLDSALKALGKQSVIDRYPICSPLRDPVLSSSQSQVRRP